MALQHIRSSTADKRPTAAQLADGQLSLCTNATTPGLFFEDAATGIVKVGPVHVGATAPNATPAGSAGNSLGEGWLDTSGANPVLKLWNGSAWVVPSAAAGGTVVTTGDTGTVTSTMLLDGTIVDADINAAAAITGTKVTPNFGSQAVTTTGVITGGTLVPTSATPPSDGVYLPAAGTLGIAAGGVERLRMAASAITVAAGNALVLAQDPTAALHCATKQYVDAATSFPSGTVMLFAQTAAPTGWTKLTTHNDKALRVVSGTASSGGTTAFTSVFASRTPTGTVSGTNTAGAVGNTTLTLAQIPAHSHGVNDPGHAHTYQSRFSSDTMASGARAVTDTTTETRTTSSVGTGITIANSGGGGAHNHPFTNPTWSGSFSGAAMDFAVQYVDVILASKD
jgi:microcystin-dependent protein